MALAAIPSQTQLTSDEVEFLQNLAGLPYVQGDLLYYNAGALTRLAIGSATNVLKVNAGATAPEWGTAGASGANTALSNLASVAINTSLVSDTNATDDLGSAAVKWNNIFGVNLGATGTRFTTGWFTDLTVTNAISASITGTAAVATAVTVADEATDTTCSIVFVTNTTGNLGIKSNANMTFNSNTGVATFASSVLTTTDINGGTVDGTVIGGSSAAAATVTTLIITSFGGNWTNAGRTVADLGIVTTVDINGGTLDGAVIGGASAAAATFTTATANSFVPNSSTIPTNGLYLPAANTLGWAVNSALEVQLTGTALSPGADGGSSLGTTALGWQNLFANTGFVLNIENSDWVATHTAGILTVGTGDLRVTTAGSNAA
ncbi:hypothetical protein KW807_02565, partial [Candidatus Parcubacteria bacterium]|nr:hypothetical protein [Candidatus Parcubacteria bacterium]